MQYRSILNMVPKLSRASKLSRKNGFAKASAPLSKSVNALERGRFVLERTRTGLERTLAGLERAWPAVGRAVAVLEPARAALGWA